MTTNCVPVPPPLPQHPAGVVLFPGFELPLLLHTPQELHLLDRALAAPAPFTRLLAVLPG